MGWTLCRAGIVSYKRAQVEILRAANDNSAPMVTSGSVLGLREEKILFFFFRGDDETTGC